MSYRDYWEKNIESWGENYLEISHGHEQLDAAPWLAKLYKATVSRLEAKLMRERYQRTMGFMRQFVGEGTRFADIGCGTGVFTVAALKAGAEVTAIDFSASALEVTKRAVETHAPGGKVRYVQADMQRTALPECDAALAMGVTPYISDLEAFLHNILPHTNILCCQYTSPWRPSNMLRRAIPALNVRNLIFHSAGKVDRIYAKEGFVVIDRDPFATGFIDIVSAMMVVRTTPPLDR